MIGLSPKVIIFLISISLAGCGFNLRGSMEMPFDSIRIVSNEFSLFDSELERMFSSNENIVLVVGEGERSDVVLSIISKERSRKIISLSNAGNVREFELRYVVAYRVRGKRIVGSTDDQEIRVFRSLTYSDDKLLAKEEEELLLFEEMQMDAASQLARRLVTLQLKPGL